MSVIAPSPMDAVAVNPMPSPQQLPPVLDSTSLLQGEREVLIRHGDEWYRLRHTRNDKLILTK
jgi:hemin uptake protein HemP